MSTCAVMLVRDEADIIRQTVEHLLGQVDEVLVADHRSVDGTREILESLPVGLMKLDTHAYEQEAFTAPLVRTAIRHGHEWVVPCDGDEIWLSPEGLPLSERLSNLDVGIQVAENLIYDHVPTGQDDYYTDPTLRIGWRKRTMSGKKIACRLRDGVRIGKGNHTVTYPWSTTGREWFGLFEVHHFSVRSMDQLISKVRKGLDSYGSDPGWNSWRDLSDEQIAARYLDEFWIEEPHSDPSLIYDPVFLTAAA